MQAILLVFATRAIYNIYGYGNFQEPESYIKYWEAQYLKDLRRAEIQALKKASRSSFFFNCLQQYPGTYLQATNVRYAALLLLTTMFMFLILQTFSSTFDLFYDLRIALKTSFVETLP
ncbi:hypothetical protein Trydic_g7893 [Trypoxylus dichotomus]